MIESAASKTGGAHVIKSHHNVGGLYRKTSQAFAVFLPVTSVGVVSGARSYE